MGKFNPTVDSDLLKVKLVVVVVVVVILGNFPAICQVLFQVL